MGMEHITTRNVYYHLVIIIVTRTRCKFTEVFRLLDQDPFKFWRVHTDERVRCMSFTIYM